MIGSVYWVLFVISLILSILYVYVWQKYFDVNITLIFLLIPVANLGFLLSVIYQCLFGFDGYKAVISWYISYIFYYLGGI